MPGNPAGHGFKVYSQADEDGILEFIFERLSVRHGSFVEIGCGNGLENNTHYLLLKGWSGVWVDADPTNIAAIRTTLPNNGRLKVLEAMVDRDNALSILDDASHLALNGLDLLSVDIDGNDLEVALACTAAWQPKVLVIEYNAKFPLTVATAVQYDPAHRWAGDDYHGASLAACVGSLALEYSLVCCNLAGTNAFFVHNDAAPQIARHSAERLYQPSRFYLTALRSGHPAGLSFLRNELSRSIPGRAAGATTRRA